MEPHDDGCSAGDKREQQSDQLHQSADQGANVLRMAEAIGGARSGERPDGGPRPSRGEIYDQTDYRQDWYSGWHFRVAWRAGRRLQENAESTDPESRSQSLVW